MGQISHPIMPDCCCHCLEGMRGTRDGIIDLPVCRLFQLQEVCLQHLDVLVDVLKEDVDFIRLKVELQWANHVTIPIFIYIFNFLQTPLRPRLGESPASPLFHLW